MRRLEAHQTRDAAGLAYDRQIGIIDRLKRHNLVTRLDVTQTFVDRCVAEHVDGKLSAVDAAKAKWWTAEVQNQILDHCVQLHGGYGFMDEYRVARFWADARVSKIWGGTNEIMKDLIGRSMGLG